MKQFLISKAELALITMPTMASADKDIKKDTLFTENIGILTFQ